MRTHRLAVRRTILPVACALIVVLSAGCAAILEELESIGPLGTDTPEDGLREALRVGTTRAVEILGRPDGYFRSEDVRIFVPDKLESVARGLRAVGAERLVDDFEESMNRAAEAAAPLARSVFLDAIRAMSVSDAVTILRGKQHEATDYLRSRSEPRLLELFRPIVSEKLDAVGATRKFTRIVEEAEQLPFIRLPALDLEDYVTREGLDGLFLTLGKEEQRIREDPLARTTALLRKYFGDRAGS